MLALTINLGSVLHFLQKSFYKGRKQYKQKYHQQRLFTSYFLSAHATHVLDNPTAKVIALALKMLHLRGRKAFPSLPILIFERANFRVP